VATFCQRLDLEGIVDRACPVRDVATLTHGQVISAPVANRLTSPTPLRRVEDLARTWAVAEVCHASASEVVPTNRHEPGEVTMPRVLALAVLVILGGVLVGTATGADTGLPRCWPGREREVKRSPIGCIGRAHDRQAATEQQTHWSGGW
jgi:uncharacterized protein DUF4277